MASRNFVIFAGPSITSFAFLYYFSSMGWQNFVISDFSKVSGWVPPRIYLATLTKGVGAYSGKSADDRALLTVDRYLEVFVVSL